MPAPPLRNTLEAGVASGTAVTTANATGRGNTPFSAIGPTTPAPTFDSTQRHSGALSLNMTQPATLGTRYVGWTALGALAGAFYTRIYVYWPTLPATATPFLEWLDNTATPVTVCRMRVTASTGLLQISNTAGTTLGTQGAVAVAAGAWSRIDVRVTPGTAATTGQFEWYLFKGANLENPITGTADEHVTNAVSVALGAANINIVRFGAVAASGAASFTYYLDDLAVAADTWVGPGGLPSARGLAGVGLMTALRDWQRRRSGLVVPRAGSVRPVAL